MNNNFQTRQSITIQQTHKIRVNLWQPPELRTLAWKSSLSGAYRKRTRYTDCWL